MSCAFNDNSCQIGLIAGTGSNACYMEKQSNITKLDDITNPDGRMCINMDWGTFGDDGCLDKYLTREQTLCLIETTTVLSNEMTNFRALL